MFQSLLPLRRGLHNSAPFFTMDIADGGEAGEDERALLRIIDKEDGEGRGKEGGEGGKEGEAEVGEPSGTGGIIEWGSLAASERREDMCSCSCG